MLANPHKEMTLRLVCCILLLVLSQACSQPVTPPKVKEEFFAAYEKEERPIDLTFRLIDQDGLGAKGLQFKVDLSRLHRFLGLFRYTLEECREVTTDKSGLVRIRMPGKKASYISFKEVEIDRYVFSKGLRNLGEVPMSKFTDASAPMELKVIRHGPPPKLLEYCSPYKEFPAADMNLFSFDPNKLVDSTNGIGNLACEVHPLKEPPGEGTMFIRVENALMASKVWMAYMGWSRAPPSAIPVPWSVTICGNGRFSLLETGDDFVSYAPMDGYKDCLNWVMRAERNEGVAMSKFLYAKDNASGRYFWLNIAIGTRNNNMIDVHLEGCTNPDGSNNLYRDVWSHKDEFLRYSKRCP